MTLNLDDLEATAKAATPGPWSINWETDEYHAGMPDKWASSINGPEASEFADLDSTDAEHIAAFDPPTVLTLIAKLREAESVIEAARESEARTRFIAWGRKPTHRDSSHTWRILTAYKPTNQEGGNDGT